LLSLSVVSAITLASCGKSAPSASVVPEPAAQGQSAQPVVSNVSSKAEPTTIENLQAAYNGESNAHVMYLAFAEKANAEGYKDVANLFTTVARAEEIHRDNHAAVLTAYGVTPVNNITKPEVGTTADNLEKAAGSGSGNLSKAIKGESYERDSMYPEFIKAAETAGDSEAVQTFDYALAAETEHAQLYGLAKADLDQWKQGTREFYVCTVTGETFDGVPAATSCPVVPGKESYEKVV